MRMLIAVSTLALVAACTRDTPTPPPPPPPGSTTLAITAAPQGRFKVVEESTLTVPTTVQRGPGMAEVESSTVDHVVYEVEVLATDATNVVKATLTFSEAQRTLSEGGEVKTKKPMDEVLGKRFTIERAGSMFTVTGVDDRKPTAAEGAAAGRYGALSLEAPEFVRTLVARGPLVEGLDVPEAAQAFGKLLTRREQDKGGPPAQMSEVRLFLSGPAGADGDVHLSTRASYVMADKQMQVQVQLEGPVVVEKGTGMIRSMSLNGAVQLAVPGQERRTGKAFESIMRTQL